MSRGYARRAAALIALASITVAACQSADPRRAVAEQFIDRLFIVIDQRSARELTTGLASGKVDEEIRLKGDQAIDETTEKPRVTYRFVESRVQEGSDTASLIYDLQIAPEGVDSFTRRLILTVRHTSEGWRVANYTLEAPAAPE